MNKLFGENGFLNKDGEKFLEDFKRSLKDILSSNDVGMMTTAEVRLLGSVLSNITGDAISKVIINRSELSEVYNTMTDEQFDKHLREKYDTGNDSWCFKPLEPEEETRGRQMIHNKINSLLQEGLKNIPLPQHNGIIISDRKRFK